MKKLEYNIAHRIVAIILAVALVVSVTPLSGLISTRAADTDWTMPDSIILAVKDASNNDEVVANQQILLSGTVEGEEKNFTISTDVNGQAVIDSVNTDANIVDTYNMINTSLQSNGEVKYSVSKAGYVTVESTLSQENINATLSKNTIDIAIKYPVITGVSYTKIEDFVYDELETSVYKGYKQDKIEMRGDRAEMSDFPLYLNTVAGGLDRRDQTIGGFSFVVKIYAVPVVEIIG